MHTPTPLRTRDDARADGDLVGRVALVTGGSRGIGRAIVRRLGAEGVTVAIGYSARAEAAQEVVAEVIKKGGQAVAVGADLRRPEGANQLVDAVESSLGPIEILVNNAGVARIQALEEVSGDDFDQTIAVNLRAPFLLAQRVAPGMRERGFGRILSISSIAAFTGGIVGPHYSSSKAGLNGLTHFLAGRLAPHGITVNAIAPGPVVTEMLFGTEMQEVNEEEIRRRIPLGRLGQPEDVADLAVAVLRNPYLTNQVISLNGGLHPQ
jgi:3-oxoacyl-[acyl-carrier protein] reductase